MARGENPPPASDEPVWREGAGSLLLLAPAHETGLLDTLLSALPEDLPADNSRRHHLDADCRRSLLSTLLFLPAVGLKRPHDLRGYTGDALVVLTGRERAYSYRHVERFLSAIVHAGGADRLTDALAEWTSRLWQPQPQLINVPPPSYYVDGHRKAVHAGKLVPRGLVSRYGKVLGCRALILLHDEHGHPLLATTHRGDTHLTVGLPQLVERYEQFAGGCTVQRVIVDREGMAAEFMDSLAKSGCDIVTVLRSNQYKGLESFTEVGAFVPLSWDRQGKLTRQVAAARYSLPLPERLGEHLDLQVALVRDLRRLVPRACPGESDCCDGSAGSPPWYGADWIATPAPAVPIEPALVPIVTPEKEFDAVELASVYAHRWPAQENVIRDWLLPLGLDTNHGYSKAPVANSEVEKKRAMLEKRLVNAKRWGEQARLRSSKAGKTSDRRWKQAKARSRELYSGLNDRLFAMEEERLPPYEYRARNRELVAAVEAEMEGYWQSYYRSHDTCSHEYRKWQRYCGEQCEILRKLEDLKAGERRMYELDDNKDHVMTTLKLALVNLVMWARDTYFPPEYARATWQRLAPFFRLPGRVVCRPDSVVADLKCFNDRQLNRDLQAIRERVAEAKPQLSDGRKLVLTAKVVSVARSEARERSVA